MFVLMGSLAPLFAFSSPVLPANAPPPAAGPRSPLGWLRRGWQGADWAAWRRFLLALSALTLSLYLALYATLLRENGHFVWSATLAVLSLLLAGLVAARAVPYLARRTTLRRWMRGMEYEVTREGLAYLFITLVIVAAALNTGNNLLFMILAALLAGMLVSGVLSNLVLAGLDLDFTLPEHLFAQQPVVSRVTLRNHKRALPSFSITVSASANGRRAGSPPPNGGSYFGLDRVFRHPLYFPYLPRRSVAAREVELTFPHRGRYAHDSFRISSRFPFGLLRKTAQVPLRRALIVLPRVEPTEEFYEVLPLISGELESYTRGRGHDLYAIRDYQESDPARHVDWKATARALQLKVREFAREDERRVTVVFDPRVPDVEAATLARFEKGVAFCACLAWHFYEIDAQMSFVTEGFETPLERARDVVYPALERLAVIEPARTGAGGASVVEQLANHAAAFHIIVTSRPRGSIPTPLWTSAYFVFLQEVNP